MSLLEVKRLDKKFGHFYALSDVSLTFEAGEVHALVGENGAGKSTLIKIVTGVYKPDGGEMIWRGERASIASPKHARTLGINVIHQERHLVPSFTGMENLYVGLPYPQRFFGLGVRWGSMRKRAESLQAELGIDIPLDLAARDMSPPERTMLEIMRAMMLECKLLFLDEPTAALTDKEAEILFRLVDRLKEQGAAIVYVSHRMDEVFRLSDRITVLRNGKVAGTLGRAEATRESVVGLMTNANVGHGPERRPQERSKGPVVLEVDGLRTRDGKVKQADLNICGGEIVGLFGLAGSGRTELLEAIYGVRPISGGQVTVEGKAATGMKPKEAITRGVVLVPEDRRADALIMNMTIRENMTLPILSRFSGGIGIAGGEERKRVSERMESMKVKATGSEQPVSELSGGNQQKVVFAKALMSEPLLLLCDEPTQAVDVMTREDIHRLLRGQADRQRAVLFVSSDLQEVLEVSDRIYVMHDGCTIAELDRDGVTTEQVLQIIYNQKRESGIVHGTAT